MDFGTAVRMMRRSPVAWFLGYLVLWTVVALVMGALLGVSLAFVTYDDGRVLGASWEPLICADMRGVARMCNAENRAVFAR